MLKALETFEEKALAEAGVAAGGYLDAIDKTDLTELTGEEWQKFCFTMLSQFGESLKKQVHNNGEIPF